MPCAGMPGSPTAAGETYLQFLIRQNKGEGRPHRLVEGDAMAWVEE